MTLHVTAGNSWWLFAAANLILFLHVAAGTVGIISGAVALLSRKGGRLHRIAGTVFLVSMLIMATIGATTSPFLPVPSMTNVAAGTLTLYLVATGRSPELSMNASPLAGAPSTSSEKRLATEGPTSLICIDLL